MAERKCSGKKRELAEAMGSELQQPTPAERLADRASHIITAAEW